MIETRRRVCYAAVEVVVGAAREAGEEVFQETMDIVENIEKHAEVVEESLEVEAEEEKTIIEIAFQS